MMQWKFFILYFCGITIYKWKYDFEWLNKKCFKITFMLIVTYWQDAIIISFV